MECTDDTSPHRRSLRLQAYDYSRDGGYFITVCTADRRCVFGEAEGFEMRLSPTGAIADDLLKRIGERFPGVSLDLHVVMPNHVHAILLFLRGNCADAPVERRPSPFAAGAINRAPTPDGSADMPVEPRRSPLATGAINRATTPDGPSSGLGVVRGLPTLGDVARAYKAVTTHEIRRSGLPWFSWQRNYHEHIIRDESDLYDIRQYIANNPAKWQEDHENPEPAIQTR